MASAISAAAQQHLVQAGPVGVLRSAHSGGGVALGVGVDYQNAQVVGGQGSGYIDGGGGLSDAALLIGDGEDLAQAVMLPRLIAPEHCPIGDTLFHVKQLACSVSRETSAVFHVNHQVASQSTGTAVRPKEAGSVPAIQTHRGPQPAPPQSSSSAFRPNFFRAVAISEYRTARETTHSKRSATSSARLANTCTLAKSRDASFRNAAFRRCDSISAT
jgi:hypothetical protein